MVNKIHIAIVDDGVNSKYFDNISVKYDIEITEDLEIKKRHSNSTYSNSHGTTCAAIIRRYYKSGILSSIKILNEVGTGSNQKLIKAIEWCIDNSVDIINLSIGSVYPKDKKELQKIVNKSNANGLIIVAANKNENIITYPASFHNVIGVKTQQDGTLKEGQFTYNFTSADGIEINACSNHLLKNYRGKEYLTKKCNSFATPMITALAAEIVEKFPNMPIELIKEKLWERSINYYANRTPPR